MDKFTFPGDSSHISRPRSSKHCDTPERLSTFAEALRLCIIYIICLTHGKN